MTDAREALMNTSRDWAGARATGNLEHALACWTDDTIVLPPDQPGVVGKAAIRAYVQQAASVSGSSISPTNHSRTMDAPACLPTDLTGEAENWWVMHASLDALGTSGDMPETVEAAQPAPIWCQLAKMRVRFRASEHRRP